MSHLVKVGQSISPMSWSFTVACGFTALLDATDIKHNTWNFLNGSADLFDTIVDANCGVQS